MNIQKISAYNGANKQKINLQKQNNNNQPNQTYNNAPSNSIKSSSISFNGMGVFFNNLVTKNKAIKASMPEKVFEKLAKKDFGAYALTTKGYVPITPKQFQKLNSDTASELIIKQAPTTGTLTTGYENGFHETKKYQYRTGISPSSIVEYVKRGFEKVTSVVDDGLHVLTIPKSAQKNQEVIKEFKKTDFINRENQETIYMMPDYVPDFWYELSDKMIKKVGTADIKLEKISNKK